MTVLDVLADIYAELPSIACKGLCWNSCGAIDMSDTERASIAELGVEIPVFTEEWDRAWRNNEPAYCPAFSLGAQGMGKPGCTVYDRRPYICRAWGVTEAMPCPHGCEMDRPPLTDKEAFTLLFKSLRAGGHPLLDDRLESEFLAMLNDPDGAEFIAGYLRRK